MSAEDGTRSAGDTGASDTGAHDGDADDRTVRAKEKLNRGLGMLSAFRDALEETIHEARERGDLSTDRAKEAIRGAYDRARAASSDAREKFDFVSQNEFDALQQRVSEIEDTIRTRLGRSADSKAGPEEE